MNKTMIGKEARTSLIWESLEHWLRNYEECAAGKWWELALEDAQLIGKEYATNIGLEED